eukprot:TRINITY_DN1380_c0_g1_i3.p1 TRINITY_DN1380_c0_g1~~TRINITY_DN1380_c0_g1_i3.p1  ORF type:complete len:213 (+),score=21.53 TRINITY_DN1380_c0_g1_i3:46-684(+)
MRCSRCKVVYYCSSNHQTQDWANHRTMCSSKPVVTSPSSLHPASHPNNSPASALPDDGKDLLQGDVTVSTQCPLSIMRLQMPAKGKQCVHAQCFELGAFLQFSQQSCIWQCPICYVPLPYEDLMIDRKLKTILASAGEEVVKIRFSADGQHHLITEEDLKKNKKRPLRDASPPPPSKIPTPSKLPSASPPKPPSSTSDGPRRGSELDPIVLD